MQRHYADSKALCAAVLKKTGPTVLLAFSAGKDAVASWLQLRECGFNRIIPYFYYCVPGLEFVEQGLAYYEEAFQTKILRFPQPSLIRQMRNLVFAPPERAAILERMALPRYDRDTVVQYVRDTMGAPDAYAAIGTRAADSPLRMMNIRKHGSLNPNRRSFQPVYDWSVSDVRDAIVKAGLKLTVDYRMFGRSFDGIDHRFLAPIQKYYPRDYERILDFFPLARLELMRRTLGGPADAP